MSVDLSRLVNVIFAVAYAAAGMGADGILLALVFALGSLIMAVSIRGRQRATARMVNLIFAAAYTLSCFGCDEVILAIIFAIGSLVLAAVDE